MDRGDHGGSDHEELRRLYDRDPAAFLERTKVDPAGRLLLLRLGAAVTEKRLELALELAARCLRELPERTESHLWTALLYQRLEHPLAAQQAIERAEALARTLDERHWVRQTRGAVLRSMGHAEEAADVFRALLAEPDLSLPRRVRVLINAASTLWPLGHVTEADRCLDEAEAIAEWPVREDLRAWLCAIRAWVAVARDAPCDALRAVDASLAALGGEALAAHRSARRARARALRLRGDVEAAEAELNALVADARDHAWHGELRVALEDLAELRRATADVAGELDVQRELVALSRAALVDARESLAKVERARIDAAVREAEARAGRA
ncbi:MAG: tetratricopeptide repeat protein [Myxococcota bacterium]